MVIHLLWVKFILNSVSIIMSLIINITGLYIHHFNINVQKFIIVILHNNYCSDCEDPLTRRYGIFDVRQWQPWLRSILEREKEIVSCLFIIWPSYNNIILYQTIYALYSVIWYCLLCYIIICNIKIPIFVFDKNATNGFNKKLQKYRIFIT